jgi:tetraprenyl-beta-curcumene synthase
MGEAFSLLAVGAVYWLQLQPLARAQLQFWRARAGAIPDERLRRCALAKLSDEALNPEAAALFAVLAPARERRRVADFIVAFQVLYDYLDALNELPGCTALATGLQLNMALTDALACSAGPPDAARYRGHGEDGGYVAALVAHCRQALGPLAPAAAAAVHAATLRCAEAQSHNHAYTEDGDCSLVGWAQTQDRPGGRYEWWELAAGAISCLGVHALVACAPRAAGAVPLSLVEHAYFPSVCALSALLDSLADLATDAGSDNHSFVSHYRDAEHASARLVAIASEASRRLAQLPDAARHKVILVGICAITSPSTRSSSATQRSRAGRCSGRRDGSAGRCGRSCARAAGCTGARRGGALAPLAQSEARGSCSCKQARHCQGDQRRHQDQPDLLQPLDDRGRERSREARHQSQVAVDLGVCPDSCDGSRHTSDRDHHRRLRKEDHAHLAGAEALQSKRRQGGPSLPDRRGHCGSRGERRSDREQHRDLAQASEPFTCQRVCARRAFGGPLHGNIRAAPESRRDLSRDARPVGRRGQIDFDGGGSAPRQPFR